MSADAKLGLLAVATIAFLLVGALVTGRMRGAELAQQCAARWADSGYTAHWDRDVGCRVRVRGRWLPERNVQVRP